MNITNVVGKYRQRSWQQRATGNINWITVHHSAMQQTGQSDDAVMRTIQSVHQNQGWAGLSYHFVIVNGRIYQTNNFSDLTFHDAVNWDSIGVLVHGYFHYPYNEIPTENNHLKPLRFVLDELSTKHPEFPAGQANVLGHRERSSTACPGDNLIGYVTDYRNKLGNVSWGQYQTETPTPPPVNVDYKKVVEESKRYVYGYKTEGTVTQRMAKVIEIYKKYGVQK